MSFENGRSVDSVGDLRAFSHPLRLQLMEALEIEGPMTATEAAAKVGTSPSNASFHLRLLARHGFVEEAADAIARGRQRPWQLVRRPVVLDADQLDEQGIAELRALLEAILARHRRTVLAWQRHRRDYSPQWRAAAGEMHTVDHLTAAELAELKQELQATLARYADRPRRPDSLPVAITLSTLPIHLTDLPIQFAGEQP